MNFFDNNTDLSKLFSSRSLEKNDVLFREGDSLGDAYLIKFGDIELQKNNSKVDIVNAGEIVGIFNTFFDNKVRMFTAVALTKGEVFIIPEQYLIGLLEKSDPFVRYCFRTFLPMIEKYTEQFGNSNGNETKIKKLAEEEEKFKKQKLTN